MPTLFSRRHLGVTIIELLITISVAAILMALAAPSMRDMLINAKLRTVQNEFMATLNQARSEAIRRSERVTLRNTSGGGNWGGGWSMFVDSDADGVKDADPADPVIKVGDALSSPMTLKANNNFTNFITFLPSGQSNNSGTFVVCHDSTLAGSKAIIVNAIGRVRVAKDTNSDGIPETDSATNITSCSP